MCGRRLEADAVVGDDDVGSGGFEADQHLDPARGGVRAHVDQCLLDNVQELFLHRRPERRGRVVVGQAEPGFDAIGGLELAQVIAQGLPKIPPGRILGAQPQDEAANVSLGLLRHLHDAPQRFI